MTAHPLAEMEQIGRLRMERLGVIRPPAEPVLPSNPIEPTAERRQHGSVKRTKEQLVDAEGGIGRPYATRDILAQMERRGAITAAMRLAGDELRKEFRRAQLDPLKAFDAGRLPGSARRDDPDSVEAARRKVWAKIQKVGGIASPAGSCLWHVIGWERSLKSWALEQGWAGRRVSQESASGILIAALGALAE